MAYKKKEKKTFLMYKSWKSAIDDMSDEDAGRLLKAIYAYQEDGTDVPMGDPIRYVFRIIQERFDADAEEYREKLAKLAENGKAGGDAKWMAKDGKGWQLPSADSNCMAKMAESVSVSVSESVSDSVTASASGSLTGTDIGKRTRFQRPTVAEVSEYCDERHNNVDPQHFVDYYDSNGWHVGKNPMKDWKAAVRTWERNSTGNRKPTEQSGREWLMQEVERDECSRG